MSGDDAATARKFRDSLKAPFPFVSDADGALMKLFDVKYPIITISRRVTFVIGPGRKVLAVQDGSDAIEPGAAVTACSVTKPKSLGLLTGGKPDAGR